MTEERPALRAADADRDRVAAELRDHLVAGRLTLDEFVERVETAHEARTMDELDVLTRDLPAVAAAAAAAPAAATSRRAPTRWAVGVMSGVEKKNRWRVPEHLNAVAVMGSVELDLRKAEIATPEVEITAVAIMGAVEVIVPEGVAVELAGVACARTRSWARSRCGASRRSGTACTALRSCPRSRRGASRSRA